MISKLRVLFYWIIDILKIERRHLPVFFFLVALSTIFLGFDSVVKGLYVNNSL